MTLLAVTRVIDLQNLTSLSRRFRVCLGTWLLPLLLSLLAAAKDVLVPTGKNWCEIPSSERNWKLGLTDSWRMEVLFFVVPAYIFICWYMYGRNSCDACSWDRFLPTTTPNPSPESWRAKQPPNGSPQSEPLTPELLKETKIVPRSEFSLPIQGPARCLDKKTETIFRWVYVRHPGLIGSLKDIRSPLPRPVTSPRPSLPLHYAHGDVCPWETVRDARAPPPPASKHRSSPLLRTAQVAVRKPTVHQPQRLYRRAYQAEFRGPVVPQALSTDAKEEMKVVTSEVQKPAPRYHRECPKITKSYDVSVEPSAPPSTASSNTLPQGPSLQGRLLHHSSNSKGTRSFSLPIASVVEQTEPPVPPLRQGFPDSTPRYHNQCPKVTQSFDVSMSDQPPPPPTNVVPGEVVSLRQSNVERATSSLRWLLTSCVSSDESAATQSDQNMPPKEHTFFVEDASAVSEKPVTVKETAKPHRSYQTFKRSFDLTKNSLRDLPPISSQPRHTVPKASSPQPVKIFTSLPPQSPTLRPEPVHTTTTITSIPTAPPPPPTPGLPPPPWNFPASPHTTTTGGNNNNTTTTTTTTGGTRRKTFLLSRSTWSDTTPSSSASSPPRSRNAQRTTPTRASHRRRQHHHYYSSSSSDDREIRRMLLLSTYVLAYVVLWLPWLVDTFLEVLGRVDGGSRTMAALSGVSQYFGVASAITFATHECTRWWANWQKKAEEDRERLVDDREEGEERAPGGLFGPSAV